MRFHFAKITKMVEEFRDGGSIYSQISVEISYDCWLYTSATLECLFSPLSKINTSQMQVLTVALKRVYISIMILEMILFKVSLAWNLHFVSLQC